MGGVLPSGFPGAPLFALSCTHIRSFLAVYVGTYFACSRKSWERGALCLQNYLTMLGSTVLIPFLLVTPMGGTPDDLAAGMHLHSDRPSSPLTCLEAAEVAVLTTLARAVIQTIFFVSGIVTLVQTFVGDRLPIIQARPPLESPGWPVQGQVGTHRGFGSTHG